MKDAIMWVVENYFLGVGIMTLFVLAWIIGAWIACAVRYGRGEEVETTYNARSRGEPGWNMYGYLYNIDVMLNLTLRTMGLGFFFFALLWPLTVLIALPIAIPIVIAVRVSQYYHRKNRAVLDSVDILKGNYIN